MYENKEITLRQSFTNARNFLNSLLSLGVILTSAHGALLLPGNQQLSSPVDFKTKVIQELHTHNDAHFQNSRVLADPKSIRGVRSEGDKVAENDSMRGNWDVYQS
ncbi:MAG: hypothetical protein LBQ11_01415 [Candidatus Nomurabacteria bacterium]|jgi:hypothetical protein|nr:hypothetical protein [Candidatus Nomurabacteria bacterium]